MCKFLEQGVFVRGFCGDELVELVLQGSDGVFLGGAFLGEGGEGGAESGGLREGRGAPGVDVEF